MEVRESMGRENKRAAVIEREHLPITLHRSVNTK